MKKYSILLSLLVAPILVACGGGSNNDNQSAFDENSTIEGTVPGTKIEAFCTDGKHYVTHSNNNGTSQHPFRLSVKKNSVCNLVMTMNENDPTNRTISEIGFDNPATGTTTKRIKITGQKVNLGYIDLPKTPTDMLDTNGDHFNDNPVKVNKIPDGATESNEQDNIHDKNGDGTPDIYEDNNNNGVVDAYDDQNNDGKPDIQNDNNNDGVPDFQEGNDGNNNGNNDGN